MVRAQGVAFAWDTSFRTSGDTHAVANWSFEVACATYNLAAATSAVALNQSLKEAFQSYQRAAGALETLAELSRRCAWVCEDMSGDTLSVLQALMLAQAQKCLYLQGHKMQPATLEITAGQCAEHYAEVVSRLRDRGGRPFCHLSPQWGATIVANEMLYTGLMHFHASTSLGATHQYGAQLARLGEAMGYLVRAREECRRSGLHGLHPEVDAAHALVAASQASALRDNELIYHEAVPPLDALPPIRQGRRMVSSLQPLELDRARTLARAQNVDLRELQGWP